MSKEGSGNRSEVILAKNPQLANLDLVEGQQAHHCLIYGGFGTNAASTVTQHLQKSPMLASNMFSSHDNDFHTFITLASNVLQGNGGARSKNGIRLCSPVFFWPPDPSFLAAAFQQEKLGDNEPECIVEMTGAIYLDDAAQNIGTINTPAQNIRRGTAP